MKKVYLVYQKKRIYTPQMELKFQGIVNIVASSESNEVIIEKRNASYEKAKSDFYSYKEAFAKGEVVWDDALFRMYQYEKDKTIVVTWEITQVEVS